MKICKRVFTFLLAIFMIMSQTSIVLYANNSLAIDTTGLRGASSTYTPRIIAPSTSNSYYYRANPFYNSGYGMPNCTAYAYGRAYELLGSKPKLSTGNAGAWWNYNKQKGYYSYGSTPKLGAIACWDKYDGNKGHVAVVEEISGNYVKISESHYRGTNFDTRIIKADSSNYLTSMRFLGYIYIGNFTTAHNPVGNIDSLTGGTNSITISGWAFDEDDLSKLLDIHVYIGGEAGSGAPGYVINANKLRGDVETVYPGVGTYHGFEETITTSKTGTQPVYVYAINTGGGDNVFLGCRTITIKDGKNPIGALDNVTGGEGYINVSGWAFDEDDLSKPLDIHVYIGGEAGSGAPCYVIKADKERTDVEEAYPGVGNYHGYNARINTDKVGKQKIYVYAINTGGGLHNPLLNYREVTITEKPKVYAVEDVTILNENGYMCTHMWIDTIGNSASLQAEILPKNATNKNVTWTTSDSAVLSVDSKGTVTAVGSGAAYVIATTEDGKHVSKCWVKTGWENIMYGDIDFNDKITATDLSVINQVINGTLTLTEAEKVIVDVDGDGKVTEADRDLINQYILKTIDTFPVEKMLSEIKITKLPDKLSYFKGDMLATNGMEITAIYHNGSRKKVTRYSASGNLDAVGKQKITVTYSEDGIVRTASYNVQVDEIVLDTITIFKAPDKTNYIQGEKFDVSGMIIQARYNNGTNRIVQDYTIENGDCLSEGQEDIKVFYQEQNRATSSYQEITVTSRCKAYEHMWRYEIKGDGTHLKMCGECGKEYIQQCELKTTKVGASCIERGYTEEYCELCGYSEIVETEETILHTYDEGVVTKEATCGSAGMKVYTCGYCGHTNEETIPATNLHTWDNGVITKKPTANVEGVKTYTCLICKKIQTESISEKETTENEKQECTHDASQRVIMNAVSATCIQEGYTGDVYCKDCNKKIESGIIVDATGHVYENRILKKASPEKNGKEQVTCKVCKEISEVTVYAPQKLLLSNFGYTYSGKANKPSVNVLDAEGNKISGKYYSVTYKNNKNSGKATVIVKFKGKYSGSMKTLFTIKPKTISASPDLFAKSKGIVVKWKKQTTQTTGYQIQYSTGSKFTEKSTKTITISKNKTTSKKISGLKANKKYYIRIRTYKTVKVNGNSVKVYSDWSKEKSIGTKK